MDWPLVLMLAGCVAVAGQLAFIVARKFLRRRNEAFAARVRDRYTGPIIDLLVDEADAAARARFVRLLPDDRRERHEIAEIIVAHLPTVRGDVREGIQMLFDEAGFANIYVHQLAHRRKTERVHAVNALGQLGGPAALSGLVHFLADSSPKVRESAAQALGRLGLREGAEPLVWAFAAGQLPAGLVAMNLTRIGPVAAEPVSRLLVDRRPSVRALAAEVIGHLRTLECGEQLVPLLGDPAPLVRANAARSLGMLSCQDAAGCLAAAAFDPDEQVSRAAIEALGAIGVPETLPVLRAALADERIEVVRSAASVLANFGPSGVAMLRAAASEQVPVSELGREFAIEYLERTGAPLDDPIQPEPVSLPALPVEDIVLARGIAGSGMWHAPAMTLSAETGEATLSVEARDDQVGAVTP